MAIKKSSGSGIPSGNTAGRPANPGIGQLYSNGEAARLELYTQASGWQNIIQETPGVSSITGNYLESTNSGVITISGTNFVSGAYATAIGTNGVQIDAASTTFNSLVQLTATFTGLVGANEPYDIKVTNPSNLFGMLPDALYVNNNPAWTTPAGSLGSFAEQVNATIYALSISDDSTITYSLAEGSSLPSGVTLSSAGVISGTLPDVASNTTYTFTVNATDGLNPVISRTFSFISNASPIWSTAAGTLGSFLENSAISITVAATDASDSISYSLASGSSLPSPLVLNSSTGVISGTSPSVTTSTIYTFTVNATDGLSVIPRTFSFTILDTIPVEYLVVAGGGGGSSIIGGGGGAGGVRSGTLVTPVNSGVSITVGNGGRGGFGYTGGGNTEAGYPGYDSVFSSITSLGGGGALGWDTNTLPVLSGNRAWTRDGGSGGGGSGGGGSSIAGLGNNQTAGTGAGGQGNSGGAASDPYGAGGGGAGGVGGTQSSNGNINGGLGVQSSITGAATHYGGGGGGGRRRSGAGDGPSSGGNGGGGAGMSSGVFSSNQNGTANTGGGGGGGNYEGPSNSNQAGGNGGSGVVVIAYSNTYPAITTIPGTLTYDQPSRSGYRVYRFTAGSGTITI